MIPSNLEFVQCRARKQCRRWRAKAGVDLKGVPCTCEQPCLSEAAGSQVLETSWKPELPSQP